MWDFVVWLGPTNLFVERVSADPDFWKNVVLPGLLSFYRHAAVPYLKNKQRSAPPQLAGDVQSCNRDRSLQLKSAEILLGPDMFQSRIGGRNGS